jgi:hypothetical protein
MQRYPLRNNRGSRDGPPSKFSANELVRDTPPPQVWGQIPAVPFLADIRADNIARDLEEAQKRKRVNIDDKYFIWKINNRIIKLWSLRELTTYRDTSVTAKTKLLHDLPLECRCYKPIMTTGMGSATSAPVLMVSDIINLIKDYPNPFIPLDSEYVKKVDAEQAAENKREEEQEENEDEPLEEEYTESFNYDQYMRMEQHSRPNPVETLVTKIFSFELIMDDFLHRIRRTITKYTDKEAAATAAAGAMGAGEAVARSVGTLGFRPIEDQLTTPVMRIAYNIWFCIKSFCCVLHDKPSSQVAMYIYNTYIEGGFLAYFSVFAWLPPKDKKWLETLFETFKNTFVKHFEIQIRGKIAISAKVSQKRCHDAGLEMFEVFQTGMKGSDVIFPQQEILYKQPYDTYKKQRDTNPGDPIPEGSIKNLISLIHGRIFDATTPWFVDTARQFGVFCGNSFSSTDAAPQKSTKEMKMFLFPFTKKEGNILKQHIDIFRDDGANVTKEIVPIRFGPLAVFAVNTGFEAKRENIRELVKVFPPRKVLLEDKTKLNFYIPKALLISLQYCNDHELTTAIAYLKTRVSSLHLENEVEVSIDDIECVCVATLSGQMSQNQTAKLGEREIPGIESTIRNKGCGGMSAILIMLGENTEGRLYNKVRGLISIFGKELGDIGKECEGAIIQGAYPSMRFDLSTGDWMAGMITSNRIMIMVENSTVTVVAPKGFLTLPQDKVKQIRLLQEQILRLKPPPDTPSHVSALSNTSKPKGEMNLLNSWNFLKYRAERCWLQQAYYITGSLRRIEDSGKKLWPDYLSFVGCLSSIAIPNFDPRTSSMQLVPVVGLIVRFEDFKHLVGTQFSQQTHGGIFDAGRFMEHIFPSPANIFKIAELRSELTFYVEKNTLEGATRRCASLMEIAVHCYVEGLALAEVVKTAPLFWLCNEIIELANKSQLSATARKFSGRVSVSITSKIILDEIKETFFVKLKTFINTYCDSKWSPIYFQETSILCNQLRIIFGEGDYYKTLSTHGVVSPVDEFTGDVSAFIEITGNICAPTCKRDTDGNGGGGVATGRQTLQVSKGGSSLSKYTRRHTRFRNNSHAQPRTKRRHLTAKLQKTNRRTIKHSKIYRNHTVKRRKSRHNNRG